MPCHQVCNYIRKKHLKQAVRKQADGPLLWLKLWVWMSLSSLPTDGLLKFMGL